jgi:cytochrome b561
MKYTLSFRVWHWLNAIVVLGLLGTVFLRKTFLSYKTNAEILSTKLADMNVTLSTDNAKILAKSIRDPMWEWHILLGYALAFFVIYRIFLYFTDKSQKESFASLSLHKKAVKILYYIFYATLFFMAASGLIIHFHELLGISKTLAHDIKELHESAYNIILAFVVLHIGGVVVAEVRDEHGLISTMINGRKAK